MHTRCAISTQFQISTPYPNQRLHDSALQNIKQAGAITLLLPLLPGDKWPSQSNDKVPYNNMSLSCKQYWDRIDKSLIWSEMIFQENLRRCIEGCRENIKYLASFLEMLNSRANISCSFEGTFPKGLSTVDVAYLSLVCSHWTTFEQNALHSLAFFLTLCTPTIPARLCVRGKCKWHL